MLTIATPCCTIKLGTKNLSHIQTKHSLSESEIIDIIQSPELVTKSGSIGLYFYKDDKIVICKRFNKHSEWFVSTAYIDNKPFIFGKEVYRR